MHEFIVMGKPVSLQSNNRTLLQSWKAKVSQAAVEGWPAEASLITYSVQLIITHYYESRPPDIDNIIKPILDGLNLLIYIDDRQITDLTVRRRKIRRVQTRSGIIAQALAKGQEFVHVKIDTAPAITELSE
ncbi:MAG: RusA family crossover junction endodeoxyribonuclease [Hormoscilla sp. SP5CHS1]|nr:RusA family crossover junction endodeoxyribonuclease [Hormoscilla sp. SP12CHS1]MBC6454556.1 RusA family crossover junction endodeoxyribonuclease [Hormoscilla sp. SP5CHS1]